MALAGRLGVRHHSWGEGELAGKSSINSLVICLVLCVWREMGDQMRTRGTSAHEGKKQVRREGSPTSWKVPGHSLRRGPHLSSLLVPEESLRHHTCLFLFLFFSLPLWLLPLILFCRFHLNPASFKLDFCKILTSSLLSLSLLHLDDLI